MGWVRQPGPPHECKMPDDCRYGDKSCAGAVWRCFLCKKLYVFEARLYFGECPPWWYRDVHQWHRARWWQRIRWGGLGHTL